MVKFTGRSSNVEGENAMMEARWKKFEFNSQIPLAEQVDIGPCERCFSELVYIGADA